VAGYIVGILFVPYSGTPEEIDSESWRVVFAFPLIFVLTSSVLLLFMFKFDSPQWYKDHDK
jgi:hypothetical protein